MCGNHVITLVSTDRTIVACLQEKGCNVTHTVWNMMLMNSSCTFCQTLLKNLGQYSCLLSCKYTLYDTSFYSVVGDARYGNVVIAIH